MLSDSNDIFEAVASGELACVQAILTENPQLISTHGIKGMSPLHMAAMRCYEPVARALIEKGVDVNARKDDGWTPLHNASQNGDEMMVCLLLDHGADPNLRSNGGQTPMHVVAYGLSENAIRALKNEWEITSRADPPVLDHAAVTQLLISRGGDIEVRETSKGATALHLAIYRGHRGVAQVLLDSGADPDVISGERWTPLHIAAARCDEDMVRLLVEKGADTNVPGKDSQMPRDVIGMANESCEPIVKTHLKEMLSSGKNAQASAVEDTLEHHKGQARENQVIHPLEISAKVQFQNVVLDAITKDEYGKKTSRYRGRGSVTTDESGVSITGKHVYSGGIRFLFWLAVTVGVILIVKYMFWYFVPDMEPGAAWIFAFFISIAVSWVASILFLKKESIFVPWSKVRGFATGKGRGDYSGEYLSEQVLGLSFEEPASCSPIIFTCQNRDELYEYLKSNIPEKERFHPYEAVIRHEHNRSCPYCSCQISRSAAICLSCGMTLVPKYVEDDLANLHIHKIREFVSQGFSDKKIIKLLNKDKKKCLLSSGIWDIEIIRDIRDRFSFKKEDVSVAKIAYSMHDTEEQEQSISILQNCPSCHRALRLPYPPPNSPGRCPYCQSMLQIVVDMKGNIQVAVISESV